MIPNQSNGTEIAIAIENLHFAWRTGMAPVLKIERLQVPRGERLFIEGPSGSGKSTLLSLVAGVVVPQEGRIRVHGQLLNTMPSAARDRFRADRIGYIYQMFNLIPYLSIVENVTLPCRFSKIRRERAAGRNGDLMAEATRLLKKLGLDASSIGNRSVTDRFPIDAASNPSFLRRRVASAIRSPFRPAARSRRIFENRQGRVTFSTIDR